MARFVRIAHDLEKLPIELHTNVLVELEFQQLIRLSHHAGPRLISSLEDSLSPWGVFFRDGNAPRMQSLLALTYRLKDLCFTKPKWRDAYKTDGDTFEYACYNGPLFFLRNRGSEWRSSRNTGARSLNDKDPNTFRPVNAASLSSHWLSTLNQIAIDTTWRALHVNYARVIEPWIAQLDGAATIFGKIPFVGVPTDCWQGGPNLVHNKRTALSIEELSDFIDFYQKIRVMRAEALANELYRLADLYEAHSSLLKMPFAPETPRSNKAHIPSGMRYEAQKIVRRASTTWWNSNESYRYRFAYPFPALIPYSWTLQLFCKVLHDGKLSDSLHPEVILKSCKDIVQRIPAWAPKGLPHLVTDDMAGLSNALSLIALGPKHTSSWQNAVCTHADEDLEWLERFAGVIAWMDVEFPDAVQEVRGRDWESTTS